MWVSCVLCVFCVCGMRGARSVCGGFVYLCLCVSVSVLLHFCF